MCVDKSEDDVERESQLLECRLTLTEERNAVLVPSAGSGIPGAPVERCVCYSSFSLFISFFAFCYHSDFLNIQNICTVGGGWWVCRRCARFVVLELLTGSHGGAVGRGFGPTTSPSCMLLLS